MSEVKDLSGKMKEEEVFEQKLSEDEMKYVAGGERGKGDCERAGARCTIENCRPIYEDGFPNCAATVEDSSFCYENDACFGEAIVYKGMRECHKAWK